MIHIFPVHKVKVEARATREQLLVCTTDQEGNLLITGLENYLKREQRRRQKGRGRETASGSVAQPGRFVKVISPPPEGAQR